MKANIYLHIDSLVLRGFDITTGQQQRLRDGIEAELIHLFEQSNLSPNLVSSSKLSISAKSIQWRSGHDLVQLGKEIAQSVYRGISHE